MLGAALETLNLREVYAAASCPLLVVNATRPGPEADALGPDWAPDFFAAYRQGISRDLAMLAETHPHFEFVELDADHGLILNQPDLVVATVERFLSARQL